MTAMDRPRKQKKVDCESLNLKKNDIELFSAKFVWNINYLNPEDPTEPIRCCQFKIFNHNHFKKSVQDFQQRVFFGRVKKDPIVWSE